MEEATLRAIFREELAGLEQRTGALEATVATRLSSVEERLSSVEERLSSVEGRLGQLEGLKAEVDDIKRRLSALEQNVVGMEARLAEGGRLQFRQLADLYRGTHEKIELLQKHLGGQLDATRGSIEALRSSLERQDFRADELGRRLSRLETRPEAPGSPEAP